MAPRFKSFSAIGLDGASIGFLAKLTGPAATDLGLWAQDATHPLTLLLREGKRSVPDDQDDRLVQIGNGSPGQGRGWLLAPAGTEALAMVTFPGSIQAILSADIEGMVAVLSQSGPGGAGAPDVPGAAGATFASYGFPTANAAGHSAFADRSPWHDGRHPANARGIFASFISRRTRRSPASPISRATPAAPLPRSRPCARLR